MTGRESLKCCLFGLQEFKRFDNFLKFSPRPDVVVDALNVLLALESFPEAVCVSQIFRPSAAFMYLSSSSSLSWGTLPPDDRSRDAYRARLLR